MNSKNSFKAKTVRGFTLIELMIVVAIVALLAAIVYPSYQDQVRKARRGQAKADLTEILQDAERYYSVNNTYLGFNIPGGKANSPRTGTTFYNITITANPATTATSIGFTATPVAGGPQANDRCGTLTINQAGVKTPAIVAGEEPCW